MSRAKVTSGVILTSFLLGCVTVKKTSQTVVRAEEPERVVAFVETPVQLPVAPSPYHHYLQKFDAEDRVNPPKPGGVVFVGSSSIARWETLEEDFDGIEVVNRGIGGSAMIDVIRYADRIILRYQPKVVVIYGGENDIALYGMKYLDVCRHFRTLVDLIHRQYPDTHVLYVSMKPSPQRSDCLDEVVKANRQIRDFIGTKDRVIFIDVVQEMLDERGNVRDDLFQPDGVHLTREAYRIWADAIRPQIEAALKQTPDQHARATR